MSCPLSDEAYDPQVYDGHNIGRLVNQGGLLEGLRELVAPSDRERGCTAYSPTVAEAIFVAVEYHVANGGNENWLFGPQNPSALISRSGDVIHPLLCMRVWEREYGKAVAWFISVLMRLNPTMWFW